MQDTTAVRAFVNGDLEPALALWSRTEGMGLNESDTPEALGRFLARNRGLSAVAESAGRGIVGAILCGHDGRRAALHHLAVDPAFRGAGLGGRLVQYALDALRAERIPRCNIYLYDDNEAGARFWRKHGWSQTVSWKTLQREV